MSEELVGRGRELEILRDRLEAASAGSGSLVLCAGEPGMGKTRLAQEFAGMALARGLPVVWGRCAEAAGAPAFWPWRQALQAADIDLEFLTSGESTLPEDRFRVFENVAGAVISGAEPGGRVLVLDDIHWADEPSLLLLRHLAQSLAGTRLLVFVAFRDAEPDSSLPRILPELMRAPAVTRLGLRGLGLPEVRAQLGTRASGDSQARTVLDLTGGNPLFVREISAAMADGTWRPDRPPRSVLDIVSSRLERVSPDCRRFLHAAAIAGRDFSAELTSAALGESLAKCTHAIDEAIAYGLLDRLGDDDLRFVHALTRDAVEASLQGSERALLHRAIAEAVERRFAGDLSDHLADIARHWSTLAAHGEAATARCWAVRAAEEAVRRLAYEDGVRLYRSALAFDPADVTDAERAELQIALGRSAYLAGNLRACGDAAVAAARAAHAAARPDLACEAALVLEAVPDPVLSATARQLCEEALAEVSERTDPALHARLLAQRSHLAYYDGDDAEVAALSARALTLARTSGDSRALGAALHARKEACPGPAGRAERLQLADEMLSLAERTLDARTAMWGRLWRIDALIEGGRLAAAVTELPALRAATERLGGPSSGWHHKRVEACLAQAQGRFADAFAAGRAAYERMRPVEPSPATGAYFSLQCALAGHVGATDETVALAQRAFESPPMFATMSRVSRAYLLLRVGRHAEAAGVYHQAGPVERWSLPAFFLLPGYVYGTLVAVDLDRQTDLLALTERLEPFRGEHAVGEDVAYLGPVDLALGRAFAALGRLDVAVEHLSTAARQAADAGAPGFLAEARYHLATVLLARNAPGDETAAVDAAREAHELARGLGMGAYTDRTSALVEKLETGGKSGGLSPREAEIAQLVAAGLTNKQIASRLVISERTAQNHVQHILTKLGFANRSQIAAWATRGSG